MDKRPLIVQREKLGSKKAIAEQLGVTLRTIQRFEKSGYPVPPWYPLALEGLKARGWKARTA